MFVINFKDDCTNIANIVKELAYRGYVFTETGSL